MINQADKAVRYYMGDLNTQKQILAQQIYHMPAAMQEAAVKALYNRVIRFYGMNNKYNSDGSLRHYHK